MLLYLRLAQRITYVNLQSEVPIKAATVVDLIKVGTLLPFVRFGLYEFGFNIMFLRFIIWGYLATVYQKHRL